MLKLMRVTSVRTVFLKMNFKIGDKVISADGYVGKIISICECDRCKERGFYEPVVEWSDGSVDWITIWEKKSNFHNYYQIGDNIFGNIFLDDVKQQIVDTKKVLRCLEEQRDVLMDILDRLEYGGG